jgi:hypothetical protein
MYEKPNLNTVGEAQDVILGYTMIGGDIDTTFLVEEEFAQDAD